MDWKRNFLESSLLRRSTNKNNPNEVQAKCVDLAYKDMMTAGRYYSALFLHTREKICRDTNEAIKQCDYVFSRDLIQKTSLLFCKDIKDIIGSGNKYVTGYGLAQKLINMTFKYLYVFSDLIFETKLFLIFHRVIALLTVLLLKKRILRIAFGASLLSNNIWNVKLK